MIDIVDCDSLSVLKTRTYGGATGSKICVSYNDDYYMLKSQQRLRDKGFRNVEISYANDPISEYIGSHIYGILGIPVHDTLLGMYRGRLCVLCKDLAYPGVIIELRNIRNSIMFEDVVQSNSGMSTLLSDIMQTIDRSSLDDKEAAKERFYQMFVVDTLIGNTDRNNGNWGFLDAGNNTLVLCPVYDCGGCLNNKRSDDQIKADITNDNMMKQIALEYTMNFKDERGKRVNPFHYIERSNNPYIEKALQLVCSVDENKVYDLIDTLGNVCSDERLLYYKRIISLRLVKLRTICSSGSNSPKLSDLFKNAEGQ